MMSPKHIEQFRLLLNDDLKWREAYDSLWALDSMRVDMIITYQKMTKIHAVNSTVLQERANTWLTINSEKDKKLSQALVWETRAKRRGKGLVIAIPVCLFTGILIEHWVVK